jgi:hypothetical protein
MLYYKRYIRSELEVFLFEIQHLLILSFGKVRLYTDPYVSSLPS